MGLLKKLIRARNKRKFKGNFGDRLREFNFRVRGNNMGKFRITRPTSRITANKHNLQGKLIGKSMEQVSRNLAMKGLTALYLAKIISSGVRNKNKKARKDLRAKSKLKKANNSRLSSISRG